MPPASYPRWQPNKPATHEELAELVRQVGPLPDDYLDLLGQGNGGEGFIGSEYIILWRSDGLPDLNDRYGVKDYAPGFLMIGSNGGEEALGFDTRAGKFSVVQLPFIGMDWSDATVVSDSLSNYFKGLAET